MAGGILKIGQFKVKGKPVLAVKLILAGWRLSTAKKEKKHIITNIQTNDKFKKNNKNSNKIIIRKCKYWNFIVYLYLYKIT